MRTLLLLLSLLAPALCGCLSSRWFAPAGAPRRAVAGPAWREPMPAGQLVIHADFALPAGHRMVSELTSQRQLVCDRLQIPAGHEPVHVFLFADERDYRDYVARTFPGFPERRAIFVETDVQLAVYAHWNDRVAEDLRHEVTHGYLHSSLPHLPLWLDEGLAEYFEVPRTRRGLNRPHVVDLRQRLGGGAWRPDLKRLEALTSAAAMTQLDYAESWLWVHYLLESDDAPPGVLTEYLQRLRRDGAAAPISGMIGRDLDLHSARLVEHLQRLAVEPPPGAAAVAAVDADVAAPSGQ